MRIACTVSYLLDTALGIIIVGTVVLMILNTLLVVFKGYYGEFTAISLAAIVIWLLSELRELKQQALRYFVAGILLVSFAPLACSQDAPKGVSKGQQSGKKDTGTPKGAGKGDKGGSKLNPDAVGGLRTELQRTCGPDWQGDRCEGRLAQPVGSTLIRSFGQRLAVGNAMFIADWTCPEGEAQSPVRLSVRTPQNPATYAMITIQSCASAPYAWRDSQFRKLEGNPATVLMTLELVPNSRELPRFLAVRLSVPSLAMADKSSLLSLSANRPFQSFQLAPDQPVLQGRGTQFGTRVFPLMRPPGSRLQVCPVWDGRPNPCEANLIF